MKHTLILFLLLVSGFLATAQDDPVFLFPEEYQWNVLQEGDTLAFKLAVSESNGTTEVSDTSVDSEGTNEENIAVADSLHAPDSLLHVDSLVHVDSLQAANDSIRTTDSLEAEVIINTEVGVLDEVEKETRYQYAVYGRNELNLSIDTLGNFFWVPDYDLVDRVQERAEFQVIFEAVTPGGKKIRKEITFVVMHTNRPPNVGEVPVFYVQQYATNEIDLKRFGQINDPDGDPFVFKPILTEMPQGATLSELGIFKWKPSRTQFSNLRKKPLQVKFLVQDQPEKTEVEGVLNIAPTQQDLPPEVLMVPNDSVFTVKEDETLNLIFYVSDPNGDDDIQDVSFLANDTRIPKTTLKRHTDTQWEFTWKPGYEFVELQNGTYSVELVMYVVDRAGKRGEKKFTVDVKDAENMDQKDERLYKKYRRILVSTMDLIDQLDENQRDLNKQLKRSRKGKRNRSIVNASLGAITGVSPVFLENEAKDYVSGIGGTAVMTIGTLEATEVMGKSKDAIMERLKINIDIRNKLQAEGDSFARKYAFRSQRRHKDFDKDIDKLKVQLNNKQMILLELDAGWENPNPPTDKNIRKHFPDYNNEGFEGFAKL